MLKVVTRGDSVKVNAKPSIKNNPLKYMLGKIAPGIFGMPVHVTGTLRDEFGKIKQEFHIYNTFTTAGKNGLADQALASPTLGKPTHMATGTGTGGTTALTTELDRNALTSKTRSGAVVTMQGDWAAADGTGALTEAGIFDAASTGNMWMYTSFSVVNKGASDTFQIVWTLTVS
jgi:hypothetical protein